MADLVRGKSVADAQAILAYSTRAAAVPVRKVLESAIANADHNHGLDPRELRLVQVTVDEGPTIKRFRPRAQGRATPIMKRTCHITIGLAETGSLGDMGQKINPTGFRLGVLNGWRSNWFPSATSPSTSTRTASSATTSPAS